MEIYFAVSTKMLNKLGSYPPGQYPLASDTFLYGSLARTRGQSLDGAWDEVDKEEAEKPAAIVYATMSERDLLNATTHGLFYMPVEKIMVTIINHLSFKDAFKDAKEV